MIKKAHLLAEIAAYVPSSSEPDYKERTLELVHSVPLPCSRETVQGHITASAWVLSPDKSAALLIHHRGLDRWFQPGGHLEDTDSTLADAAKREAIEETGVSALSLLQLDVFDIDIHTIPTKKDIPEHLHYDVRYVFLAKSWDLTPLLSEVKAVKWVPLSDMYTVEEQGSLLRMANKVASLVASI